MAAKFTAAVTSTCSGMVETFEELMAIVISMDSLLPCKILLGISAENYILVYINGLYIFVGVCWAKFWWYTPVGLLGKHMSLEVCDDVCTNLITYSSSHTLILGLGYE